jgi:hypothetical protein
VIVSFYLDFLPRQNYAIRTGVHPNTAFGLLFALDYARATNQESLADLVIRRGLEYYQSDRDCPIAWEPGGEDFFSPCLMEAFLMSRLLTPPKFNHWFRRFLPGFFRTGSEPLLEPATVLDRSDGKLVHLDGLNLSRAWCLFGIAPVISDAAVRRRMVSLGIIHGQSALTSMKSEDYAGGHWLGTFAIYMFGCRKDRHR